LLELLKVILAKFFVNHVSSFPVRLILK